MCDYPFLIGHTNRVDTQILALLLSIRLPYVGKSKVNPFSIIVITYAWTTTFILIILYYVYFINTSMTVEV